MKLKTLLATALVCLSATVASAQAIASGGNGVNKINNAQINDEEYANLVTSLGTSCAIVLKAPFLSLIEAKKNEINKEIEDNYTSDPKYYDLYGLDALEEFIVNLEKKQGDYNLDGKFTRNDVQALVNDYNDDEDGFDYDGNGGFSRNDIQTLTNMYNDYDD